MGTGAITILLQSLSIGYKHGRGRRVVAEGINAQVAAGELTCLLGANGIGKSTLLRTLTGSQPRLGGGVLLLGKELAEYSARALARCIAVVLTERPALHNMTAEELVSLGRSPYTGYWGRLTEHDQTMVRQSLEQVGIVHLAQRMLDTLSDGERQKSMIAKALAQDTPIVLLDEPTAFLDFPSKVEMMRLLYELSRSTNKTIFMITHDLELALQIADKIWLMDSNAKLHIGTPEDLALRGDLQRFFTRKGIAFDASSGLFRVDYPVVRTIGMEGSGVRLAMVRKALRRKGIAGVSLGESQEKVNVEEGRPIRYTSPLGISREVETIEGLLDLLDGRA